MKFFSLILLSFLTGVSCSSFAAPQTSSSSGSATGYIDIHLFNTTSYSAVYRNATVPYFVKLESPFPSLAPYVLGSATPAGGLQAKVTCENSNNDDLLIFRYDMKDKNGNIIGSCNSTITINCTVSSKSNSATISNSYECSGPFKETIEMSGPTSIGNGGIVNPNFTFGTN